MSLDKFSSLIEAILYFEGDIVKLDNLKKTTGLKDDQIKDIIIKLNEEYQKDIHGLQIVEIADGFSFQIKKEVYPEIKNIYKLKAPNKLSKLTLTVLSIIAYKQPITKGEMEEIKGVSCDSSIKRLLEINYIQIVGRKDVVGKPLMYGTTQDFLKHFNLKSIKDLPQINELKSDEFSLEEE